MFKKLIARLYDKHCRVKLDSLFLGGIQRDLSKIPTVQEIRSINSACIAFTENKACDLIFNEILKDYSESLFSLGETEEARNILHNNINVVLKVEKKIRDYAHPEENTKPKDPYDPL